MSQDRYTLLRRFARYMFFCCWCSGILISAIVNQSMLFSTALDLAPAIYDAAPAIAVIVIVAAWFGVHRRRRWAFSFMRYCSCGALAAALLGDFLFLAYAIRLGAAFNLFYPGDAYVNVVGLTILWLVISTISGLIAVYTGWRNNWFLAVAEQDSWFRSPQDNTERGSDSTG